MDAWWRLNLGENGGGGLVNKLCLTFATPWTVAHQDHGISQARILEWVFISFSRRSSQLRNQTHFSCTACEFFTPEPPGFPLGENGYMYMDSFRWTAKQPFAVHLKLSQQLIDYVCACVLVAQLCLTLVSEPARLLCP